MTNRLRQILDHRIQRRRERAIDALIAGGGVSEGAAWADISGKPSVFPAEAHTHPISDVSGLQSALDGKQAAGSYAATGHSHAISDTTGLQAALDGKQASGSYAAASHTHPSSGISDSTAAGRSMLTAADAAAQTALLNAFSSSLKGLAPASGGGTSNFLRADGTWATPAGGGGGGSITSDVATLGADVALSSSNTFASGPAVTLAAGTWLLMAHGHYHKGATTASHVVLRIWDGSAAVASIGAYHASVSGINLALACNAIVTPASSTTYTLQMATTVGNANALMKAATVNNGQGNTATRIIAIKLA